MAAALIVAEPEGATRGFLERQLVQDGFQVVPAVAAGEALDLAERLRPDLVLLAELELCLRLREGEPGRSWDRDVPVILLGPEEGDSRDRVRLSVGPTTTSTGRLPTRGCGRMSAAGGPASAARCLRRGDQDRPPDPVRLGRRAAALPSRRRIRVLTRLAEEPGGLTRTSSSELGFMSKGAQTLTRASRLRRQAPAATDRHAVRDQRVGRWVPADAPLASWLAPWRRSSPGRNGSRGCACR